MAIPGCICTATQVIIIALASCFSFNQNFIVDVCLTIISYFPGFKTTAQSSRITPEVYENEYLWMLDLS